MNYNVKSMSFQITEEDLNNLNTKTNKYNSNFIKKSKSFYKFSIFTLIFASLIIFGSIAESILFANQLLEVNVVFGYIYLSILSAVIYFVFTFSFREIIKYLEISKVEKIQAEAKFLEENPNRNSINFAKNILEKYKYSQNENVKNGVETFRTDLPHLEYAQILPNISEKILSPIDMEVEKLIFKYAKENGIATAISPIPLFDALFIIWRNIRMVNQISEIYGFRAGLIGNFTLLKRVAEQLIFIGVAELTADSFSILTGQTIVSKLSSSIAQGVGHSILTVRIGLATIQVSRPIQKKSDVSMILRFLKSFNPFKKDN